MSFTILKFNFFLHAMHYIKNNIIKVMDMNTKKGTRKTRIAYKIIGVVTYTHRK